MGVIQLPRAGQEVIVDFFGGDPNMPFVSGRLTNPDNMPLWQLPNEKVLSGLKSKEYQGSQSNQLVMDDTAGKLQVQLKSDYQSSELNLGCITRINPVQGRADFRGEGFELRTDGHGVVRADKGLILTSFGKQNSQGYVKDIAQTTAQLEQATEQHQARLQVAIDQQCEERNIDATVSCDLTKQVNAVKGVASQDKQDGKSNSYGKYNRFSELANAQIVISSLTGIALTAKQSIHLTSTEHIALTSQKQVSVTSEDRLVASVVNGIRAFSQQDGIKLYAGKDDIELQAQDGKLEAIARQDVQVISTEGGIEIVSPKVVSIKVGGTELKITPEGVFITTPGVFKVKAGEHRFEDKGKVNFKLPNLPNTKLPFSNKFDVYDLFYKYAFDEIEYIAETASGRLIEGTLDEHGRTGTIMSAKQEDFDIAIGFKDASWGFEFEPDEDQDISDEEMNAWADNATQEALNDNGLWVGPYTESQESQLLARPTDEQYEKYPVLTNRMNKNDRFLGEYMAMRFLIASDNDAGLAWSRIRSYRNSYKEMREDVRNAEHYLYSLNEVRKNSYEWGLMHVRTIGYSSVKGTINTLGVLDEPYSGKNNSPFRKSPATIEK
ncbi:DUF2345 domain-containing protein [Mannheimia pernigra]|uniref:DUF2345 domain-containing protein n=1 Tax=Mannheimia pernigra TaxID=111844 RepID=A0A7D5DW55_9PAST|nr:type VI secretion system Vgr family protein [Mannheimia pernigra]QLB40521.1 DUF2345 domain-containing protein [Mannheimia pernigra]